MKIKSNVKAACCCSPYAAASASASTGGDGPAGNVEDHIHFAGERQGAGNGAGFDSGDALGAVDELPREAVDFARFCVTGASQGDFQGEEVVL
jgi:hypothetical protein